MKIVIGSDHAGFQLKVAVGDLLRSLGYDVLDVGAFNENPSDYPDFAEAVGRAVLDHKAERGVLICLVLGSRIIGSKLAEDLVKAFLGAKFTNEERHVRRLNKVKALESKFAAGLKR